MNWKRVLERNGVVNVDEGVDPFDLLAAAAAKSVQTEVQVELARTVELQTDQGKEWVKCGMTLNVICPQKESLLNTTAEVAFLKAMELMNSGMATLAPDVPPLGGNR
jgi:hypothetical protein